MGWTVGQQAAIDRRGANVLVSAAAGSGKTAVLTERVFRRIVGNETEQGIDIDRFLIVTFTSAAAQEMKERIASKLSEEIERLQEKSSEVGIQEQLQYLEKQLALIGKASISTIHSFCLKLVKNYFNHLDIDPNVKVGDESELHLMKLDIIEALLEEAFEEADEEFLHLADTYGHIRGMEPLIELMLGVHTFSKSTVFPKQWLDEMSEKLECKGQEIGDTVWDKALIEDMVAALCDLEVVYEQALALSLSTMGPALYEGILREDLVQIQQVTQRAKEGDTANAILEALRAIRFGRLPGKKQECDEKLKEQVKGYRDLAKKIVGELQDQTKVLTDQILREKTQESGRLMRELVKLVEVFDTRYSQAKKEQNIVDYNDLEHMCLQLLVRHGEEEEGKQSLVYTEVATELAHFYEEIYIDEYQDSNMVQETLLGSIAQAKADGPTRFMVGDMKQSIYRFRLANPLIFADKYERFNKFCEGDAPISTTRQDICIDLSQNFRSRELILNATNDLFEQVMSKRVGELTYDDDAQLKVGNHYDAVSTEGIEETIAQSVELHLIENTSQETGEEEDQLEDLKGIEVEAHMVAQMIRDLIHGKGSVKVVYDKEANAYRPVEARDIVILLRSVQNKATVFEEALLEKGIDAYADIAGNFFDASEVQTILALLHVIDNPKQDIPLLTVLRSPIVRVDFDTLLQIRKHDETTDFYTAMQKAIEDGVAPQAIITFNEMLQRYRQQSTLMPLEEMISRLYTDTGYLRYVTLLPTGLKKKANLKMLKDYAEAFEAGQGVGVFSFLQYMKKLETTGANVREAKLVGESENLVRIMTIHKSKGLEFPIVFVCNTDKKFNNQDIMKSVLLHHQLGFGPKFVDETSNVMYETVPFYAIKNKMVSENISEEIRVLYVALTRAKEKLYLTGVVKDMDKQLEKWSQFALRSQAGILPLGLKHSPTYLNWIGMSLVANEGFDTFRERLAMTPNYLYPGKGQWAFKLWQQSELQTADKMLQQTVQDQREKLETWDTETVYSEAKDIIYSRLNYQYPHKEATTLPVKMSVSEIKKKAYEESKTTHATCSARRKPSFITDEQAITGAARGTLIHMVFEQLDLQNFTTYESIEQEIARLIREGKLVEDVMQVIDMAQFVEVAQSPLLQRMREALHVWKEKAFVYLAPANTIEEDYPEDEDILVQGIVDTCFIETDGLVLVDYKSDYIDVTRRTQEVERVVEQYRIQLDLYSEALGAITQLPVKERWLYLYSINEWVCVK